MVRIGPVISQILTLPNPPLTGLAFTITLTGSDFGAPSSTVLLSGPGCSPSPCVFNASGTSTQMSGQAILAAPGIFSVALRKKLYSSVQELQEDLDAWLRFYNEERSHQGYRTQGRTPWQAFQDGLAAMSQPQAA